MELKEYKNRSGKVVKVVRLETEQDMETAYLEHLMPNAEYNLVGSSLTKNGKTVALGDYLVIDGDRAFTEVDGMFRRTYYPASFTEEQVAKWLTCPTLILMKFDTAEDALAERERRGL